MRRLAITSAGGAVAAFAAVAASSCCALPMALAFMGVSTGVVGALGPLHALRGAIIAVAAVLLVAGWAMAIRRGSATAYPILSLASALLVLSLFWQTWDPIAEHLVMRTLRR
jgi:mercuric ion transport protein